MCDAAESNKYIRVTSNKLLCKSDRFCRYAEKQVFEARYHFKVNEIFVDSRGLPANIRWTCQEAGNSIDSREVSELIGERGLQTCLESPSESRSSLS